MENENLKKQLEIYQQKISDLEKEIEQIKKNEFLNGFLNSKNLIAQKIQQQPSEHLTLVMLGIDNFGFLNQTLGLEAANLVLNVIFEKIKVSCELSDSFSRWIGDEFIIIFSNSSRTKITRRIKAILKMISESFVLFGQTLHITASAGICNYPQDAKTMEELVENAAIALRYAKKLGKNNYQYYRAILGERERYIQHLQMDLMGALEKKEFFLCYQPQVCVMAKKIVGVEAVIRWKHPRFGIIKPVTFIPLLEKTDQIIAVGDWVLEEACRQAQLWHHIDDQLQIAVNVSAKQIKSIHLRDKNYILNCMKRVLKRYQVAPQLVELEITESIIVEDDQITFKNFEQLKQLGVKIACDDFGTGYASFGRLRQLMLNTIKIDRSLIQGILGNTIDYSIVKSIITLATEMNVKIIAEGVSTKEEVDVLLQLGCHLFQGYYFFRPMSANKLTTLLKNNNSSFLFVYE